MYDIFRYCEAIAKSSESVLITGETGVGKELLAKALHNASGRSGPFVAINVAGLDDHAFSDTLLAMCVVRLQVQTGCAKALWKKPRVARCFLMRWVI